MKIGDRVYVHGYVDEIRTDTIIIRNDGGYFGTVKSEIIEAQKPEDIVNVVRCKDCIWNREKEWVDCYMSGMHGRNINNFCSQGKRREE